MNERQPFDRGKHITKLSRRARTGDGQWKTIELDYMEVKWRIVWLRTEQPDARIDVELVRLDDTIAVARAHITLPSGGEATDYGSETPDDWKDYIEKSCTKAIGRACAQLGFGTQWCQDYDFAEGDPEKVVDAPVQHPKAAPPSNSSPASTGGSASASRPPTPMRTSAPSSPPASTNGQQQASGSAGSGAPGISEPQLRAMYAIARGQQAMDDGTLEEWCRNRFGCPPAELSRRQASEAIDALKLGTGAS